MDLFSFPQYDAVCCLINIGQAVTEIGVPGAEHPGQLLEMSSPQGQN